MTTTPPRSTDRCDYDGRTVRIEGNRLLNFGSSSFLGLELRPELSQGARDAMCAYGTASPFARYDLETPLHAELEELLAQMTGASGVLVTASPETAHLGALQALAAPGDAVLLDRSARKSLLAAVSALRGVPVDPTRIRRSERLDKQISLLAQKYERVWLVFGGMDPTFGELAPFDALAELLERNPKLWLYVDDGDSTSWCGPNGRGAAQAHFAGHPRVIVTLDLGGSFAAGGGALLFGDVALLEGVRARGEAVLGTAVPAPMLGAAVASARIHCSNEFAELQARHRRRIDRFFELASAGRVPLASVHKTPVFFLHTGTPEFAAELARGLAHAGFYVCPTRFAPGSPKVPGVRFTVSLHNELSDIERFVEALGAAAEKLAQVRRPMVSTAAAE
jgi:7-keto-8-aminopelargonate synthetase-like enzyme